MGNQVCIHCRKRGIDRGGKAFALFDFTAEELKEKLTILREDSILAQKISKRGQAHVLKYNEFEVLSSSLAEVLMA